MKRFFLFSFVVTFMVTANGQTVTSLKDVFPFMGGRTTISIKPDASTKVVKGAYDPRSDFRFHEGILSACGPKYGFIDEQGNVLPGLFKWKENVTDIPQFSNGAVIMRDRNNSKNNQDCYIIYKDGSTKLIPIPYVKYFSSFSSDGLAVVTAVGTGGKDVLKIVNTKGQIQNFRAGAVPCKFNVPGAVAYYEDMATHKFVYINRQGQPVMKTEYVLAGDFCEGLAVARKGPYGLWTYINSKGEQAFDKMFKHSPSNFSCGYAVIKKAYGQFVMIDKSGKEVTSVCKQLSSFYPNGLALVWVNASVTAVIDTSFKVVRKINIGMSDDGNDSFTPEYWNGVLNWNGFTDFYGNNYQADFYICRPASDRLVHVRLGNYDHGFFDRITGKMVFMFGKD